MDPRSRAAKKNTSHGNEVLPQDTMHLMQRPCYQRGSPCQDPAGNGVTWRPDHLKRCKLQWYGNVSCSSSLAKTILQGYETEDKADGGRGGKTASGNGQAWSSPSPRGQWRTGKNGGNWLWNHLWCLNDPSSYGIDGDDDDQVLTVWLFMICLLVIAQPIVAIVLGKAHIFQLSAWMNTEQIILSGVCLISATVYQRRKK